jgi:hypothetical protein
VPTTDFMWAPYLITRFISWTAKARTIINRAKEAHCYKARKVGEE